MRTDQNLARDSFRFSDGWRRDEARQQVQPSIDQRLEGYEVRDDGSVVVHSLSGNERNRLFMNRGGTAFDNLSALSGLDNPADSRGWAWLDYDRDGWLDIALVNANAPLLNLYRNQIAAAGRGAGGIVALRFVGGGRGGFACRDGYGAVAALTLGDGAHILREHRCGDGFASQNSATMVVGIGASAEAAVKVRWPSGRETQVGTVPEGTLVTVYEEPGRGVEREAYRSGAPQAPGRAPARGKFPLAQDIQGSVAVYTTTATWCGSCRAHLPALARLAIDGVELFGVPIDPLDDAPKLAAYVEENRPAYRMLTGLDESQRRAVDSWLARELHMGNPLLPSSVITDAAGNVLEAMVGIPTVSQVRKWLAHAGQPGRSRGSGGG